MNVLSPHIALYRLFDVADEIDLGRLSTPRLRLSRARLGAVRFENPPGEMELGVRNVEGLSGLLTARLYEFGVVSLSFRIHLGERVPWEAFLEKGLRIPELPFWEGFFLAELAALEPHLWARFCQKAGLPELVEAAFSPASPENPLYRTLCAFFAQRPARAWEAWAREEGLPLRAVR